MVFKAVYDDGAPAPIGAYSQGVTLDNGLVFLSGQIGLDPATGDFAGQDLQSQIDQVFKNIQSVLRSQALCLSNVVKLTIFLQDLSGFAAVNQSMEALFSKPYPARSLIQAARLPKEALIEVEVMAYKPCTNAAADLA